MGVVLLKMLPFDARGAAINPLLPNVPQRERLVKISILI